MGHDDEINISGEWRDREGGGTATFYHEGRRITGHGTGGIGHSTLTNRIELEGHGGRYEGTVTAVEGVVVGRGRYGIEILSPHEIEVWWDGNWSGGGASGHAEGRARMHREHHH